MFYLPAMAAAAAVVMPIAAVAQETPEVCFMLYMMADNDLEGFIYQDLVELYSSPALVKDNLNTWIYFDSHGGIRDYDGDGYTESPFPFFAEHDYEGAAYLKFDRTLNDFQLDKVLGETNSDSPSTVCSFVSRALQDCAANGATEYFLTFSSHGAGYGGFGGDENLGNNFGRRLIQENLDIVNALNCALDSVAGIPNAPEKFDVVGFDACLMSSFLAVRDYYSITNYFLASEALEPGHGWFYGGLSDTTSALSMALQLHDSFLTETQAAGDRHQTPKTLSLIDTFKFYIFMQNFEALATELARLLSENTDIGLFAAVQRTRDVSAAFEGYIDNPGTRTPSLIDIGSFLSNLDKMCNPSWTSSLRSALDKTKASHEGMFITRGVGPGTKPGNGIHVLWPSKRFYQQHSERVNYELAYLSGTQRSSDAWISFLSDYLLTSTPDSINISSVCGQKLESDIEPQYEGQLLINPRLNKDSETVTAMSDITLSTDTAYTEYGFYADKYFGIGSTRRLLEATRGHSLGDGRRLEEGAGRKNRYPYPRKRRSTRSDHRHRQAQEIDYSIIFTGALDSNYDGPTYYAFWERYIYILSDSESVSAFVYVDHIGDGSLVMPVLYFPNGGNVAITQETLPPLSLVSDALALGAFFGELQFSVNVTTGAIVSPMSLYANGAAGSGPSTISEIPRFAEGKIVPVVSTELGFGNEPGDFKFVDFAGLGLDGKYIYDWGPTSTIEPLQVDAALYGDVLDLETMVFDLYAHDLDRNETEVGSFDFMSLEYDLVGDHDGSRRLERKRGGEEVSGNIPP